MKYLCLAYEEEAYFHDMSRRDWDALRTEVQDYVEQLRRDGYLIDTLPLQSSRTAKVVRVRDDAVSATDGPFIETKEQLGGYFLIEAKDIDEAVAVASRWPSARFGSIEVRPIEDGLKPETRYAKPS